MPHRASMGEPADPPVTQILDLESVDSPAVPPAPTGGISWGGKVLLIVVALAIAALAFSALRSTPGTQAVLFVPIGETTEGFAIGDIHLASLEERINGQNRLLSNVSPEGGRLKSFIGNQEVEDYGSFGLPYEQGQLLAYQEDGNGRIVLAHLRNGEVSEMLTSDEFLEVFQSGSGLFGFFGTATGCEAFGFDGLDAELIGIADYCVPSQNYLYLVDVELATSQRTVRRYDVATRELTQVTQDEGPGRITVSYDGNVLVMTRFPTVAEGLEAPASDAGISVFTPDSPDAVDLAIEEYVDEESRTLQRILNDGLIVATRFSSDEPDQPPLLFVPFDGGPEVQIGDIPFATTVSTSPSGDAVLIPGLETLHLTVLTPDVRLFEFETDGLQTAAWVDSNTALWVDSNGGVHTADTDGTRTTVGAIPAPEFGVDTRVSDGRLRISFTGAQGEDTEGEIVSFLFTETDGLVDVGPFLITSAIDGPGGSTIVATYNSDFTASFVGLLDPSTGGPIEAFDETELSIRGLATNESTVTYSTVTFNSFAVTTRVADLSDPSSIEVEVFEGIQLLSATPTMARFDSATTVAG